MKIFDKIQINKPRRTAFDLSHERKFTMNMGDLVPVMCEEVIPGDSFRVNMEQLVRFQPLIAPMMHRVNVYTHFFFVPNRLVWSEWEKFITGGDKGIDAPVFPMFTNASTFDALKSYPALHSYGSLMDYLGIPVNRIISGTGATVPKLEFSQLPFRAYQLIYNEYYRDQNLEDPIPILKSSGTTNLLIGSGNELTVLRKRAWEKDYFTSALPYAQKGTQLTLPIIGDAPVTANGTEAFVGTTVSGSNHHLSVNEAENTPLKAELSSVNSASINELRQAFQIQKWLERNARGGSRYIETLLNHFGVKSSDARLQRPEYLGGGKTPVTVSEVLQNSATEGTSPQGNMAGHGISVGNSNSFKKYFEEHGFIIGIMSVMPRTAYYQGMPRHMMKTDKFDYFWPEFAHLGEQEVYNNEIYLDTSTSNNQGKKAFGYQPRYTEYRYVPDTVHGDLAGNLEFWHLGRKFETKPSLNNTFIKANPSTRAFAVTEATIPKLIVNTFANVQAIRPIPKFGNPGGI